MTEKTTDRVSLELTRTFPTTCGELYRCFTEPEHVKQWFGPKGVTCTDATIDARPDGRYRIVMTGSEGSAHIVIGRFIELDPPNKIRMSWAWESQPAVETLVTLRFDPFGDGARLTLTHERFATADASRQHSEGWESSFECLAVHLA